MASQVDRNYEAFEKLLPELLKTHAGKFALMHDEQVVDIFDTAGDAFIAGRRLFGENAFSVQEIIGQPVDLGFFSHAVSQR